MSDPASNASAFSDPAAPRCRLCAAPLARVFVDLGMSPLSNAYLRAAQLHAMEPFYPLRTYVCDACLLVQLPEVEKPAHIFAEEYLYFSSYSASWLAHSEAYAAAMCERFGLGAQSFVVEAASNDGYLLQYFKARGVPVLGVEPAGNVAKVAVAQRGVPTEVAFFGVETAKRLVARGPRASLFAANNVLAHVPDLHDFVAGIALLLAPDGVVTVEFPHLLQLCEQTQFDTIYHEHYSYFSLHTARQAFAAHGLEVFDVDELPTHGGSLRVYARHGSDASKPVTERVRALAARERAGGYEALDAYVRFRDKVDAVKFELLEFLIAARRAGKTVAGYGAPAKGNTLLNYCGVREDLLPFTVDRSPHKQGRFLPGTHIPVYAPEKLDEARPDYVLLLPWNLRDELYAQLAPLRARGAQLVVPIPKLAVLP